ncbi:hypothetical protein Hbl1158_04535 [Halobaculum sp. CBA1158]|uniref:hypothetical protein n=1 Tax=Halobaculum sp. CBA1158 TaxID=2904243 RepID=UPI001F3E5F45|nr:hypothetical protein [Halobaculum sp. CBA1158]UIP00634.1 hypothetical protein Hbl1158_04535 [Halobaculum sp. CBA1158]
MNWPLLRRGLFWYSLLGGGASVALLVAIAGPGGAVGTFVAGLASILWVTMSGGNTRTTTSVSNADSMGVAGTVRDPGEGAPASMGSDVRVFFYGVGLLACSPVAVAVTELLL